MSYVVKLPSTITLLSLALLPSFTSHAQDSQDTMVVTASGFAQDVQKAPASITVINSYEFANKHNRDITSILQNVPGIEVTGSPANNSQDVSIRGMSSLYTLFLVDGRRITNSRDTRPGRSAIGKDQVFLPPIQSIERIEIIRGPMSTLYGSDAIGGVVNIITKKITMSEWSGGIKLDSAWHPDKRVGNEYQTGINLMGPLIDELLGIKFNGEFNQSREGQYSGEDNGSYGRKMRSGNVSLVLTPNEYNTIEFSAQRSEDTEYNTPGKSQPPDTNYSASEYPRNQYMLAYNGEFGIINTDNSILYEKTYNGTYLSSRNITYNTTNKLILNRQRINFGAELYQQKRESPLSNTLSQATSVKRDTWSYFAEDEISLTQAFTLSLGGRLSDDEYFGHHFSPKAYGVWTISDNYTLKGGYSTGYRIPNLTDVDPNWGGRNPPTRANGEGIQHGNKDLKPESSKNYEVGLLWSNDLKTVNTEVTIFKTDFKNEITWRAPDNLNIICDSKRGEDCRDYTGKTVELIRTPLNIASSSYKGVEASANWLIQPGLKLVTNYSYSIGKVTKGETKGTYLNLDRAIHSINTNLDWQATEDLSLWSGILYKTHSRKFGKDWNEDTREYDKGRNPNYLIVNSGLSYNVYRNTSIYFNIYNLFNKKTDTPRYSIDKEYHRYYNLGVNYQF